MLAIHPIHRRLAEIHLQAQRLGGYHCLPDAQQLEVHHCLVVNADLIAKLDSLKELALHAHEMGDMEWQQELSAKIEELEVRMI